MRKTRVGILRGGFSPEYEISLKTGEEVIKNLPEQYEAVDIFVDRKGIWHVNGIKTQSLKAIRQVDLIWNAMHGELGEDGQVSALLDKLGIPHTGSKSLASIFSLNKDLAKSIALREGVKTPLHKTIDKKDFNQKIVATIYNSFPQPSIVKPALFGSSIGIVITNSLQELFSSLQNIFRFSDKAIIEEYISGKEIFYGVVESSLKKELISLPPIEISHNSSFGFLDYNTKKNGEILFSKPSSLSKEEEIKLGKIARILHNSLGLRFYSGVEFIVNPKRGYYFIEADSLPALTTISPMPKALNALGISIESFLDHIIKKALNR